MKSVKYLILGAGISGLAFAYEKRDDDYVIFEKGNECGGLCRSFFAPGFVWDVAGHFFHFHSDETRSFVKKMLDVEADGDFDYLTPKDLRIISEAHS